MKCKNHTLFYAMIILSCTIIRADSQRSDSYTLACGAKSDATDSNGRKWTSDANFFTCNNSISTISKSQDPSLPSTVPYMKARIFKSKSTYKFSVSPTNRHWIRLHFYPSAYDQNLGPSTSFFSVSANGFTLLSNFSASITASALTQAYIIKEFSMTRLGSGVLELTFTPSYNSFAFINGIEVIPMPEIFHPVPVVGFSDPNMDVHTVETMFRLNVGGQYIGSKNDDLSRAWYDDSPYIYGAGFGVTSEADKGLIITYSSKESRDIAPLDVYRTARSMGPNATLNVNYNLTWIFKIDVNFTYLVRLHFCEYTYEKVNQRVFSVLINNRTAEIEADVVAWTGGKGVAMYKDYAIYVNAGNGDQMWLALHPNVEHKPEYYDSILNGLEVFKMNDTRGNLAGPNPVPRAMRASGSDQTGRSFPSKASKKGVIIGSVLGSVAGLGLVLGLFSLVKKRMGRDKEEESSWGGVWLPIYGSWTSKGSGSSQISSVGGGHCRHFTLAEIRLATLDFSEARVIGVGGFGKVYKGFIDGDTTKVVAIKRAHPSSQQGVREFLNEIELLSKLRHRHLVSLIGACEENNEMILVYDYMANGSLRQHLYNNKDNNNNTLLTWPQRLGICIGAARGIHYLHTGAKHTIIHRDVKSTNILLDQKWVAKVSDFGLSRTGPTLNQTHVSTVVKGSFGYLDPEYFRRQHLTDKSDVYSFGVVLIEVLCGRAAINPGLPKEEVCLADWAVLNHREGTLDQIVDEEIRHEISDECFRHFTETAVKCLSDHSLDRPPMGEVLWNLEYCLELQNNPQMVPRMNVDDDASASMVPPMNIDDAYALLGIVNEDM